MRGSVPRRIRECAIVATEKGWAASAARVLRAHGYAVANMPDLHYADLLVAASELRIVMMDDADLRPQFGQITQLRRHHEASWSLSSATDKTPCSGLRTGFFASDRSTISSSRTPF